MEFKVGSVKLVSGSEQTVIGQGYLGDLPR